MSGSTASTPQANDVLENIDAGINSLNSGTVPQKANNNTPRRSQIEILQSIAVGVDGLAGAIAEGAGVSETAVQALVDNATSSALGAKADKTELTAGLAAKADTIAVTNALVAKADKTDLSQVKTTADAALPKTGGTAADLKVSASPTQDTHVVRKTDLDEAILVLPSLASVATRTLPTAVTAFRVLGYATPSDGGESGPWVRVSSEPTHPGKKQDASGAWFELQTYSLNPLMFGASATAGSTDQTVALTRLRDYWLARQVGNFGDQWNRQPEIFWPAGQWRAPGLTFSSYRTGISMRGCGNASLLDGIQIEVLGNRHSYMNFMLMEGNGIQGERYGFKIGASIKEGMTYSSRSVMISNVLIRDRYVGFYFARGGGASIANCKVEKSTIAFYSANDTGTETSGDSDIINLATANNTYTVYLRGSGEFKFTNCHLYGGLVSNLILEGDDRIAELECYWNGCTFSNLQQARSPWPVKRIIDNGNGNARAILWENIAVTSVADFNAATGTRFVRGSALRLADARFQAVSATGSITSLKAAGSVELLSGAINWTSQAGAATAISAAINAGTATHGYRAYADGAFIYVIPSGTFNGSAQNGMTLVWTLASGTMSSRAFKVITTVDAHGFVVGDAVEFNNDPSLDPRNWNGIELVAWVDSATQFAIDIGSVTPLMPASVPTDLKVTKALRATISQDPCVTSGFTGITAYNASPMSILDVGPGWVDLGKIPSGAAVVPIPYSGNDATGSVELSNYGIIYQAWDSNASINDQFNGGQGNVNMILMRGSFNASFVGNRTKSHWWVDTPVNKALECTGLEKIGISRGRSAGLNTAKGTGHISLPRGTARGWGYVGMMQSYTSVLPVPAESGPLLLAPHFPHGLQSGQAKTLNRMQLLEDQGLVRVGNVETRFKEWGVSIPAFMAATLPDVVKAAGCTVRVTDRNNQFVTSDGTNWRTQDGQILDQAVTTPLASSDEEAAALTPPVAYLGTYTQSIGDMMGFTRVRLTADPAGTPTEVSTFKSGTYSRLGSNSSLSGEWNFGGRASVANYVDSTGVLQQAAVDALRLTYDPVTKNGLGALVEGASSNLIRNPRMEGGTVGGSSGSSFPTYMNAVGSSGLISTFLARGVENGVPYIDIQVQGTATATTGINFQSDTVAQSVVTGMAYTATGAMRMIGGSIAGWASIDFRMQRNIAGTVLELLPISSAACLTLLQSATDYWSARIIGSEVAPANMTTLNTRFRTLVNSGSTVNTTFRFYPGQIETGRLYPSSLMLPAAGSLGVSSRSADKALVAVTPSAFLREGWRGSIVLDFTPRAVDAALVRSVLWQIDDGTDNNRLALIREAGDTKVKAMVVVGGVETISASAGSLTSGIASRIALSWRKGVVRLSLNGGTMVTLSAGWSGKMTGMLTGNNRAGSAPAETILQALYYYNLPIIDAQVVSLSTVGAALP